MQVGVSYCEAGWQVSKREVDGDGTVEGTGRNGRVERAGWRWYYGDGRVEVTRMAEWGWQGWQSGDGRDGRVE